MDVVTLKKAVKDAGKYTDQEIFEAIGSHNHDGVNSEKITWGNVAEKPEFLRRVYTSGYVNPGATHNFGAINGFFLIAGGAAHGGTVWLFVDRTIVKIAGAGREGALTLDGDNQLKYTGHAWGGSYCNIYNLR